MCRIERPGLHRAVMMAIVAAALLVAASDAPGARLPAPDRLSRLPHLVLWAWERRENLTFIDPDTTAVAYLAYTLHLADEEVVARPRFQPLTVPPHTTMIAVVRIEVDRRRPPTLSPEQGAKSARIIAGLARTWPAAIQIDFDARRSERDFYSRLLAELRRRTPASIPISMTALASWCIDDDWISGLPVDEAVPMIYRMGIDAASIRSFLQDGGEFTPSLSRNSIGLSLDAPIAGADLWEGKRVYLFSPRPWTAESLRRGIGEVGR